MRSSDSHSTVSGRGGSARSRNSLAQAAELLIGAPVEPAHGGVEALAQAWFGRVLRVFEPAAQGRGEPPQRGGEPVEPLRERQSRVDEPVDRRSRLGLEPVTGIGQCCPRQHLLSNQRQKALEPLETPPFGYPLRPAVAGEDAGRGEDLEQCPGAVIAAVDEVADAPPQPAGARASTPLGAGDPAAQLASLAARQPHRKGIVGGLEQMVAFVENVTGRHRRIVQPAQRRLGHDQGMVGDDEARATRLANVLFDKAAVKMRAGGMHAFAAAVGERADPPAADQLGEPAGKIAAHQISGLAGGDPARHQPELRRRPTRPRHRRRGGFLVIQQAQEILPPLAHDDAAPLFIRVGVQPLELAGDLVL